MLGDDAAGQLRRDVGGGHPRAQRAMKRHAVHGPARQRERDPARAGGRPLARRRHQVVCVGSRRLDGEDAPEQRLVVIGVERRPGRRLRGGKLGQPAQERATE